MQSELKPCPFCGGKAELRSWDWPYERHQVRCSVCKAHARSRMALASEAIAAWNTRASDAEITRPTEALRLQMEAKHKEAAEAKLWFNKAQEWKDALRAAEEREKALREALGEIVYETTHLSPMKANGDHDCTIKANTLDRFILPKPDPLVEAVNEAFPHVNVKYLTDKLRSAIETRGGRIVWEIER